MGRLGAQSLMVVPWRSLAALLGLLLITACATQQGVAPSPDFPVIAGPDTATIRQLAVAHRQLGLGLEAAGDTTGAVDEYEAALALGPWPVDPDTGGVGNSPYGDLARFCRGSDSRQLVIRTCTGLIVSYRFSQGELAEFLANRADAYFQLSDMDRALRDYETVLDLENSNPRGLFGRGRFRALAGQHTFALTDFNRAIGGGLDNPETRYVRAMSLAAVGDFDAAIEDYDLVLSSPEGLAVYPDAYRDRARAQCRNGQADAAAIGWQVWLDATPGGAAEVREMLTARGYLDDSPTEGFGPAALSALRAWTDAGCPEDG